MKLMKKATNFVWALCQHSTANRAEAFMINHYNSRELADMGLTRGELHQAVHSDCEWCKGN